MARIVLATMGSLGDLHPKIALALELKRRGHTAVVATWEGYREKIEGLGLEFTTLRPTVDQDDKELVSRVMDSRKGPEVVIREIIFPHLRDMYDDLYAACSSSDLLVTGEIVYVAGSLAEKEGVKWVSTSLAPLSMFSNYDPNVYPTAEFLEYLRPLPVFVHENIFRFMKWTIRDWLEPVKKFRRDLGLSEDADPIFRDKYSRRMHLAMFSKAIARPQPDWPIPTLQTGFCFYDESESAQTLAPELSDFFDNGESPIVFTLGSAASMDPRDFFEHSAEAARSLNKRAVLIYGRDMPAPPVQDENVFACDFAPYSLVFPRASVVVHQAGIGTTAQVLRAGVPQLAVPFSHDQPDNAARCRRQGVAEILDRHSYTADAASKMLKRLLDNPSYREEAERLKSIVLSEHGTATACNAIEKVL